MLSAAWVQAQDPSRQRPPEDRQDRGNGPKQRTATLHRYQSSSDSTRIQYIREVREIIGRRSRTLRTSGDHVVASFPKHLSRRDIRKWARDHGFKVKRRLRNRDLFLITKDSIDVSLVDEVMAAFESDFGSQISESVFALPDPIISIDATPNDPLFRNFQYPLNNTGQTGGTVDADIDAAEAWDIETGSADVLVAVLDTGIELTHPDLVDNIWVNPGEIAGNGIDDDNNGFIDDINGWDFVDDDNDPTDLNGHGTHCAGIIGAVGNNAIGVTGINWDVSLVGLRILDADGNGVLSDAVEATDYAARIGCDITNNSYSSSSGFMAFYLELVEAAAADILVVAAAGNDGSDNDLFPQYPASYDVENVIAVAASDHNDGVASFSNYGATSVDIAAPGVRVASTYTQGRYFYSTGTSMAAPQVAGVAALMLAANPSLTYADLKTRILATANPLPQWSGVVETGARLDAFLAVSAAVNAPDIPAIEVQNSTETPDTVDLTFATQAGILYTIQSTTDLINWTDEATQILGEGEPITRSFAFPGDRVFFRVGVMEY